MLLIGLAAAALLLALQRDASEQEYKEMAMGLTDTVVSALEEYMVEGELPHEEAVQPVLSIF
jgi:hypothetical protein